MTPSKMKNSSRETTFRSYNEFKYAHKIGIFPLYFPNISLRRWAFTFQIWFEKNKKIHGEMGCFIVWQLTYVLFSPLNLWVTSMYVLSMKRKYFFIADILINLMNAHFIIDFFFSDFFSFAFSNLFQQNANVFSNVSLRNFPLEFFSNFIFFQIISAGLSIP